MVLDRRSLLRLTAAAALVPGSKPAPESGDVAAVLRSQTSALFDAVAVGDAAVWRKYLHDDCVYTSDGPRRRSAGCPLHPGRPRYRYVFRRDPSGAITGFAERREAWDLPWSKEK